MAKKFERLLHRASIINGELVFENPSWFKGMIQLFADCRVDVIVERRKSSPTKEQWGYLWGVVYPTISESTGHSPHELHTIMKRLHLLEKHVWRGKDLVTVKGASDLTLNELVEFIGNVVLTANEMGIEIPPPDKLYFTKR